MEKNQNGQPLAFSDVLEGIPPLEEAPMSFAEVLDTLPQKAPAGFTTAPEPTKDETTYHKIRSWFEPSREEAQGQAAVLLAISEITGQRPSQVAIDENALKDLYEVPELGEAIKLRADNYTKILDASRKGYNASIAYSNAIKNVDEEAKLEAIAAMKESAAIRAESADPRMGTTEQWVSRSVADLAGQLYQMMDNSKEMIAGGAALGGYLRGPAGAVTAAGGAAGFGMLIDMYKASLGSQTYAKVQSGMDEKLAYLTSIPTAGILAISEKMQMSMFVKNIPGVRQLTSKALATAAKNVETWAFTTFGIRAAGTGLAGTAQEGAQSIVEQLDIELAKVMSNELDGTNLAPKTKDAIVKEVMDTMVEVGPGMLVLGGAGQSIGAVAATINRKADERKQQAAMDTGKQHGPEPAPELAPEPDMNVVDNLGQEINIEDSVPFDDGPVADKNGDEVPSAPITEEEIAIQETGYDESPISTEEFDNLVLLPEEELDAAIEEAIAEAQKTGDRYGDFISGVRQTLGNKQARIVEGFIKARARATGRTKEQFADDHRLAFRLSEGDASTLGSVEFIKDGETIVRAFRNTDLKSVTHEVSHIFRKDMDATELAAAEKAFGVTEGKWSTEQEEVFAESFVQYIATGKAPSKGIAKLFDKFRLWLAENFAAAQRENVNVSPEMAEIFSRMLEGTRTAKMQAGMAEARQASETLFSKKKSTKTQIREATGQTPTRANVAVDEFVALKESLKRQVQVAQKAASEGDKKGYARATAEAKATVQRARNRSAVKKSRAKVRARITKLVKKQKVKKQAGKPKGKYTADFQKKVNELIDIMSMPVREARAAAIARNVRDLPQDFGSDWDTITHFLLLTRGNMGQMDEKALMALEQDLKAYFEYGVSLRHAEIKPRMDRVKAAKAKLIESMNVLDERLGNEESQRNFYDEQAGNWQKVVDFVRNGGILDFHGLMERLDMGLNAVLGKGSMRMFTETKDAENQSNTGRRERNTQMLTEYAKALGLVDKEGNPDVAMAERKLWEEERQDNINLGNYEVLDKEGELTGKTRRISRSRPEMRKLWMELQDPEIRTVYENDGMTDEMMVAIRGSLTDSDMAFIDAQFAMYDKMYEEINAVYRVVYGVDLPRSRFYSPILRDVSKGTEGGPISDLLADMRAPTHTGAGSASLKSRIKSRDVTTAISDVSALNHYIRQMEHFKAFAPVIQEWNGVFKDEDIRRRIIDTMGRGFLTTVDNTITNIARNGTKKDDNQINRVAGQLRGNIARGLVGLKVLAIPKQFSSFLAFSKDVDMKDFGGAMMEWMRNPVELSKQMKALSPFLQNRGDNIERDLATISQGKEFQGMVNRLIPPSVNNMVMAFVRAGDIGAMYAGGYAFMKVKMDGGMSQEQALEAFEILARDTQQSSELGSQSSWQQGNEFLKMLTMFTTSQRQYAQTLALAVEAKINGKASAEEVTKTFLIMGVALPVLFQVVSQAGMEDEDDFYDAVRSILATPLAAIPLVNMSSGYILNDLFNGHTYGRGMGNLTVLSPAQTSYQGAKELVMDDLSYRETLEALRDMAAIAEYIGLPGRQAGNIVLGIDDVLHGEAKKGALEIAGMSSYSAAKRVNK